MDHVHSSILVFSGRMRACLYMTIPSGPTKFIKRGLSDVARVTCVVYPVPVGIPFSSKKISHLGVVSLMPVSLFERNSEVNHPRLSVKIDQDVIRTISDPGRTRNTCIGVSERDSDNDPDSINLSVSELSILAIGAYTSTVIGRMVIL